MEGKRKNRKLISLQTKGKIERAGRDSWLEGGGGE